MWIPHVGWGAGVGGQSTINLNSGAVWTITGAFRGGRTGATGFVNIVDGASLTAPWWEGGGWEASATGGSTHTTQTGGSMTVFGNMQIARAGLGTHDISGGTLQVNGTLDVNGQYNTGAGTLLVSGGEVSAGSLRLAPLGGTSTGVVTQSDGTVRAGSLTLETNGNYTLQGGTLGVNAINDTGGTLNWGGATLTTRLEGAGNSGTDNYASGNWGQIRSGSTLAVTGDLATGFGGADSTLDLRSTYLNNGQRIDIVTVSGTLDLSASGDTLNAIGSPYSLRPNIGTAVDYGSIPLITADTLIGTFDSFTGITQDNIGWSEYTGAFALGTDTGADLPVNTWFLEQNTTTGEIIFHYKVEGSVPEPGTVGFLAVGLVFLRTLRQR